MSNYVERHLYDSGGHTGEVYYVRIVRRGDGYVWDPGSEELKAPDDIAWSESYTLLEEQGPVGEKTGVFPIVIQHDWRTVEDIAMELYNKRLVDLTDVEKEAVGAEHQSIKNIPAGTYDIIVYKQESISDGPINLDNVEKQFETKIGDIFGF